MILSIMCCWFWSVKTSKGEGDIHLNNTMNTHDELYTSSQLKLFRKDIRHTRRDNQCLTRGVWCIIPTIWGKWSLDTCGTCYFNFQWDVIWEEQLECEMILRIDIFICVDMIYGKVLPVNVSCTQGYDDSDVIATIKGEIYVHQWRTTGSRDRAWSSIPVLITAEIISASTCYVGDIVSTFEWEHVYTMGWFAMWKITGMHLM